ncbi:ABC transporter ATP-binding protein [Acetobacterium woodii]|uniref:Oligopeptide ABC transport system ATP-binding protein OppD3 n=1 Tax=Acetobacterium woodii (strain ATCC 29683 / DSM 1030 / JCM 2381 / KCTC 1655 / WB1) TaxID=931626 RepID=H6LEE0_ACEWD|nr:ABC transporter ATP-binding protein [Acetobacterium woodii]AFA46854.1 oligopeptide ABC transport system ATP-binding protein OppD3 [Acetobacterium woodii DSM 1030]
MQETLLKLQNVEISYNGEPMVTNVNLDMKAGEILGIVGESGSGKSTLIKAAMGLLDPAGLVNKGEIFYKGQNVLELSDEKLRTIRGPEMGMIFQNCGSALCPIRTIGDQLYETMEQHGFKDREAVKKRAEKLFNKINLKDCDRILNSYPFELSGGMNQRVGIVMAMILEPELLLADEPTSALDVTVQAQVIQEMMALRDEFGTGIVIVTHNIGVVSYMADQVAVMCKGKVVEYGKTRDVIDHPQKAYTRELIQAVPRIRRG